MVEAGNRQAFTQAVRKILQEPDCVLNGEALAKRIKEENSAKAMADKYLKLYGEVKWEEDFKTPKQKKEYKKYDKLYCDYI